ncbi:MAG: hypothetical protein IMHGJWDQ_001097 [Candidatus Fervidibacter sp.]
MLKKIRDIVRWAQGNWPVLLFWLACAIGGWYLGAKGYGMALYFRLTGINPEEWPPLLRLTAQNDPKVGSFVSLEGLTDWDGKPFKLPFPEKMTGLWFVCGRCGLEKTLRLAHALQNQNPDKVKVVVVYIGQPDAEFYQFWNSFGDLIFLRDPQLTVFERLNAPYMPRLYLIAPGGTLRYLSPLAGHNWQSERWQEELERIRRLLGG